MQLTDPGRVSKGALHEAEIGETLSQRLRMPTLQRRPPLRKVCDKACAAVTKELAGEEIPSGIASGYYRLPPAAHLLHAHLRQARLAAGRPTNLHKERRCVTAEILLLFPRREGRLCLRTP
jgi:hypothetical protein